MRILSGARLKPLREQVVVITGASSGIGRATAILAAKRGARVVLAARSTDALEALAEEIRDAGGRALAVTCDVSDSAAVRLLAEHAAEWGGGIDSWVNNAGVAIASRLDSLPEAEARRLFDVNFWGTVAGCQAALPFLEREGGALINLGSVVSDVAAPLMGIYAASKHAIRGYTDALRIELLADRSPVSVTLIKPAPIATPVLHHQRNRLGREATMPPPFYLPEDVATAILYATQHRVRHLYVGSAARIGSLLETMLPAVTDWAAARFAPRLLMNDRPSANREDNLFAASTPTTVTGDTHGRLARRSLYTAARVHPKLVGAVAGGAFALFLLASRSREAASTQTVTRSD